MVNRYTRGRTAVVGNRSAKAMGICFMSSRPKSHNLRNVWVIPNVDRHEPLKTDDGNAVAPLKAFGETTHRFYKSTPLGDDTEPRMCRNARMDEKRIALAIWNHKLTNANLASADVGGIGDRGDDTAPFREKAY